MFSRLWDMLRGNRREAEPAPVSSRNFFLVTFPIFSLSTELLDELRAHRSRRGLDKVQQEHDAFMLDPGLGPGQYLSSDGRILWDDDGWGMEGTRRDALTAVIAGIDKTKIERLRELLPNRPDDASACDRCHGTGTDDTYNLRNTKGEPISPICMPCAGLGWTSLTLNLDESVLETRRANSG